MDHSTVDSGIGFVQQFGIMGTIALGLVAVQVLYAWRVRRDAVIPTQEQSVILERHENDIKILRERYHKSLEDIFIAKSVSDRGYADLRVDIERRVTYIWLEDKLLPKIDDISSRIVRIEQKLEHVNKIEKN